MKRNLLALVCCAAMIANSDAVNAQTFKAAVFDLDLMVQAMPGYRIVDSLVQRYEEDTLGFEFQYNQMEFQRLDSTFKVDSPMVASGVKQKMYLDKIAEEKRKIGLTLVYWQQIAQNKSNNKRGQLARPLYEQAWDAYQKVLARKKYDIILKPQTYESGFVVYNLFLSVARELKMQELPQELMGLGSDPDVTVKPPATKPAGTKPKTN